MNCMNCGAFLADSSLDYCPSCGANVQIQKKADYLSKYHYNLGLEKAQIRDLSGAIGCLRQSLTYNKKNIQARNLLGLVYFETGEVVAALSEWVISKNLMPNRNLAGDYIARLQANTSRLDAINDTIRKYNEALALARQRHDDMAAVQLRPAAFCGVQQGSIRPTPRLCVFCLRSTNRLGYPEIRQDAPEVFL